MPFRCIRCSREINKDFKACPHCGEPVTDFLRRYLDEPIDGKYEIVERLGAGGMGEVYKVRHTYLGALRVVKVIRPQISDNLDANDRFLREARMATKVQHPNVATLHDFSALPDGSHYMVWEYIEGENLAQRLRTRGPLAPRRAVSIAIQALNGLEAIHRAGIIHRDISPENLMVTRDAHGEEHLKIIDLGVAKSEEPADNATRTGIFVGKLRYASPEQLGFLDEGAKLDGRADLYALAVVLYEMVAGRPPFEATSPHQYILHHSRESEFRPLEIPPDLPGGDALQKALQRALERDRNKRFATAREFAASLAAIAKSLPDPSVAKTLAVAAPDQPTTVVVTDRNTLTRTTVKTEAAAAPTVRTPLPAPPPTVPSRRSSISPVLLVVAIVATAVIVGGAAAAFMFITRVRRPAEPVQQVAQQTAPAVQPQATLTVEPPPAVETTTITATSAPTTTEAALGGAPAPSPAPERRRAGGGAGASPSRPAEETKKPEPKSEPKDEPVREEPPSETTGKTYVEGGDSDRNDALLAELQRNLSGVKRVAVRGTGDALMTLELTKLLGEYVTVSDDADVVIQFKGTLDRARLGRKRRAADATITKNGRVIFRYQMPPEDYRVGDTPAEAFARVLSDAFGH